jgi:hypothetical protein
MVIKVADMGNAEHVFTWENPDTLALTNLATGRMAAWCKETSQEVVGIAVQDTAATMFMAERGIEWHRLGRIKVADLLTPVILCDWRDNTHLLVDGHHRYVYAALLGVKTIPAYMLTHDQWEPFVIEGVPPVTREELLTGFSGLH